MSNIVPITPLEGSSNIAGLGYDPASQTLAVQFRNGATWHYPNFDQEAFDQFSAAESKGQHFAANIRGKVDGLRVDADGNAE